MSVSTSDSTTASTTDSTTDSKTDSTTALPHWMSVSDTTPIEIYEQPELPLWTPFGWSTFETATPKDNTFSKTLKHLWTLLSRKQARLLIGSVVQLREAQVQNFLDVLCKLSDGELMVLASLLEDASQMQFKTFLEVLSDVDEEIESVDPYVAKPSTLTQYHDVLPLGGFQELQTNIRKVPGEIREIIMDHYFENALIPKFVFPDQTPSDQKGHLFHKRIYPQAESQALLALSRRLLHEYRPRYWSGNTWVIGTGEDGDTMGFLSRMEFDTVMQIRSVHLAFSLDDVYGASKLHLHLKNSMQRHRGYVDNFKVLGQFAYFSNTMSQELQCIWWYKFAAVCYLKLDSLVLDFNNAYGPDGELLAHNDWVGTLPRFRQGLPGKFTILTSESQSTDDIRAVFDSNQA